MTIKIYIYGLKEVDSDEIRYIGQSINVRNRLSSHLWNEETKDDHPKHLWIENAKRRGVKIEFVVLEECQSPETDEVEREQAWIDYYTEQGHRLTNVQRAQRNGARGSRIFNENPFLQIHVESKEEHFRQPEKTYASLSLQEIVDLWIEGWDGFRRARRAIGNEDSRPHSNKISGALRCAEVQGLVKEADDLLLTLSDDYPTFCPLTSEEFVKIEALYDEIPYWI